MACQFMAKPICSIFLMTVEDLDSDGMEGTEFCFSPPPLDKAGYEATKLRLTNETF